MSYGDTQVSVETVSDAIILGASLLTGQLFKSWCHSLYRAVRLFGLFVNRLASGAA